MDAPEQVAAGVYRLRTLMVNLYFVSDEAGGWVLVDTGIRGYGGAIRRAAERLFGAGTRPATIVLTHGHFDHVGGLPRLAETWGAPVYAHPLELPYLRGAESYPAFDPTAGGGLMSVLSPLNPRTPIDLDGRVHMLPASGGVPGLLGWRWVHTPGHTVGHVSLFRQVDGTLIAGDAVVTTKQESAVSNLTERELVWRPPAYATPDWRSAGRSVAALAALEPEVLATGHGRALAGPAMRRALHRLADHFDEVVPSSAAIPLWVRAYVAPAVALIGVGAAVAAARGPRARANAARII